MSRTLAVVLILLFACTSVDAKPRHWFTDWRWWAGEGVIVGALVADGRSSCVGYTHNLVEGSALGHGSRSCGAAIGTLVAGGAIYTSLHVASVRIMRDDPSRAWRVAGYATVPVIACAFHCSAAVHNYNLIR